MVLRPIFDAEPPVKSEYIPAWTAIERQQTAAATSWWLITQPDHATLSGAIAEHFSPGLFPLVDRQIVSAIGMHDAGWSLYEHDGHAAHQLHPDGRPVAFFEIEPQSFLRAWTASIDRVQEDSAMGAYMVSQHFDWLGRFRLERADDPSQVKQLLLDFVQQEEARRRELLEPGADRAAWDSLLSVLQFCDLCSLYLCSGTRQPVEFPHQFSVGRIHARYEGDTCVITPAVFLSGWNARVAATRYAPKSDKSAATLSIPLK